MPYIKKENRKKYDALVSALNFEGFLPDPLMYLILDLCKKFAKERGGNYEAWNAVMGVLPCASLELCRRTRVQVDMGSFYISFANFSPGALSAHHRAAVSGFVAQAPVDEMTDGELNYLITRVCHSVILHEDIRIRARVINLLVKIIGAVVFELYDNMIAPYEDTKIKENGVVSEIG